MTAKSLRLVAQDEEDLKILSAHLQDAILRVSDLTYLPRQRRFALVLNRYCWEGCDENALGTRVLCGLHFDDVLAVKSRGLARDDATAMAQLLAIRFVPGEDGGGGIELLFAGGAQVRLDVECIAAGMSDLTDQWPAAARPAHALDEAGETG